MVRARYCTRDATTRQNQSEKQQLVRGAGEGPAKRVVRDLASLGNNILDSVRRLEDTGPAVVPPWLVLENRFRLWTPYDMIRFHTGLVIILTRDLFGEVGRLNFLDTSGEGATNITAFPETQKDILGALAAILKDQKEMPIPIGLHLKIQRLKKRVEEAGNAAFPIAQLSALCADLLNDIIAEMASPYFLMIPAERREMFEQKRPLFGEEVAHQFPASAGDIAAAGRCLALDEWTAAVFHLMRSVEAALHLLARRMSIKRVDIKDWALILVNIDAALASMRQQKRTPARDRKLQYFSEARAHFGIFKDAWRNHVMHSRTNYDERQAISIYNSVHSLMQQLTSGAPR